MYAEQALSWLAYLLLGGYGHLLQSAGPRQVCAKLFGTNTRATLEIKDWIGPAGIYAYTIGIVQGRTAISPLT
jgi:hypothetical protein